MKNCCACHKPVGSEFYILYHSHYEGEVLKSVKTVFTLCQNCLHSIQEHMDTAKP